jgi:HAD superfamily hydrolase (TIGR01509 family)
VTRTRAILFDLGGVLLRFDRERRVRAIIQRTGAAPRAVRAFMASDIHHRLDSGEADERDLAAALAALAGRVIAPDEACDLILSVFEAPNAALWALAERLRERFIVGGFSDNPAFVRRVFPAWADLDPMFWSSELGLTKPSPEAFAAVQARLGLPPAAILFIDDTLANIEQARRMGWDGVVFASNDQLAAELAARGIS